MMEQDLRAFEKAAKIEHKLQGHLTKQRLRSASKYPKLKAKGAQTRHLARYALDLAARKFNSGSTRDRRIVGMAQSLCKLYDIMSSVGQFFSPAELHDFETAGKTMLKLYTALYSEAAATGQKLWKFPPKGHLIDHLVSWQAAEWGNPAYFWCYADEDLVGLCVEIAESCHPRTMAPTALVKWLILAFDEF